MLVRLDRDVFAAAVGYTARAVPSRPAQPVHAGLLLEAQDGRVQVSGGDPTSRVWARAHVPAQVTPGRVLLAGRVLADIARALPTGPVELALEEGHVVLTGGKARFQLPVLPLDDYPQMPVADGLLGAVPGAVLADVVAQVAFAAQADSSVPSLTGVHVEADRSALTFVATDRFRLAVGRAPWSAADKKAAASLTVPAKALADAVKGLARDGQVSLSLHGQELLTLTGASRSMTLGALECDYPRWQSLVPASSSSVAVVNAQQVADALARVSIVKDHAAPVRLTFAEGELQLAVHDGGDTSGSDAVECELRGPGMTIGVNPHLLREGLLACSDERVRIELTGPSKPALVSPAGDGPYRYLVMPVRLGK